MLGTSQTFQIGLLVWRAKGYTQQRVGLWTASPCLGIAGGPPRLVLAWSSLPVHLWA